jgi:carbonic anhydrase
MTAAQALQRLIDGNARFVDGTTTQRPPSRNRLLHLAEAQHPFATVLGCSDSRVPPEMLFDQGLGELFIVRVAGNVVGSEILGSLGYALEHLGTPLFVILGHEGCGAVQAALQATPGKATGSSMLAHLLTAILPALEGVDRREPLERQLQHAVEANVRWAMRQLAERPAGRAALADGRIQLVGAVYSLTTGRVHFLREEG